MRLTSLQTALQWRDRWHLWIAILALGVTVIIWLGVFHRLTDAPISGEPVLYWLIILVHNAYNYILVLALSLLAVCGVMLAPKDSRTFQAIVFVVVANICAVCACFSGYFNESMSLAHVQTAYFQQRIYHLLHTSDIRDGGDVYNANFVLYECDSIGLYCTPINEFDDIGYHFGNPQQALLIIDSAENALYVELTDSGSTTERHRVTG